MASRATYQNTCPEVTEKPWSAMSPDAEGRGRHNTPGPSCHRGTNTLALSPEKTCNICYITFLNKSNSGYQHII